MTIGTENLAEFIMSFPGLKYLKVHSERTLRNFPMVTVQNKTRSAKFLAL